MVLALPGQNQHNSIYFQGKIILSEGSQLDGLISYETGKQVLFQTSGLVQSFSSSEIEMFSFFDESRNVHRTFIAIRLKENHLQPEIFEVLREAKDFAFLVHTQILEQEKPINPSRHSKGRYIPKNISRIYGTRTSIRKEETFYILTQRSGLSPYVRFIDQEGKVDVQYLDKHLLEDLAGTSLNELLNYESKKDLKPKAKNDLVLLINKFTNLYHAIPSKGELINPL